MPAEKKVGHTPLPQKLVEALQAVLTSAVILSAEYLKAFEQEPMTATIQGWDKARWIRALKAKAEAESLLAELEGEK